MEKGEFFFTIGPPTLMFGGIIGGVYAGNTLGGPISLLIIFSGYFGSMFWVFIVSPLASLIANKDKLIRATIHSTMYEYRKTIYNFWMWNDPLANPETSTSENPSLHDFEAAGQRPKSFKGREGPIEITEDYSIMTLILKDVFNHPRWGPLFKVRIRWKGNLRDRLLQRGCRTSRWGVPDFKHNTGDVVTVFEIPVDDMSPEATVREPSNFTIPLYELIVAPGDIRRRERAIAMKAMSTFGSGGVNRGSGGQQSQMMTRPGVRRCMACGAPLPGADPNIRCSWCGTVNKNV